MVCKLEINQKYVGKYFGFVNIAHGTDQNPMYKKPNWENFISNEITNLDKKDVLIIWTSTKFKTLSLLETPLRNEKASHKWEEMFVIHISDEGAIAII